MTSDIPQIGGFRIEGNFDSPQLVLLDHAQRDLIRYRLTLDMVCKLAIEIPKYANKLASHGVVDGFAIFKD